MIHIGQIAIGVFLEPHQDAHALAGANNDDILEPQFGGRCGPAGALPKKLQNRATPHDHPAAKLQ